MKKIISIIVLIATIAIVANCSTSSPIPSVIYTGGTVHHEDRATGGKIGPGNIEKVGKSCSTGIGYINYFYFGRGASVQEAMNEGGIKKIGVIDYESTNVLGSLFYRDCVVVWGE